MCKLVLRRTNHSNEEKDVKKFLWDLCQNPTELNFFCFLYPFPLFFILPYSLPFSLLFLECFTYFHVYISQTAFTLKSQNQLFSEVSRATHPQSYLLLGLTEVKGFSKDHRNGHDIELSNLLRFTKQNFTFHDWNFKKYRFLKKIIIYLHSKKNTCNKNKYIMKNSLFSSLPLP